MNHFETIICPECKAIEVAEVVHTLPLWHYAHTCSKCNHDIIVNEWSSTGHLWNDDIMRVTGSMKNGSVDLVLCDPPYGVRKSVDEGEDKVNWDDKDYFDKNVNGWLKECLRIAKHTVIFFCAGRMIPYIMREIKPELLHRLHIWMKPPGTQYAGASHNNIWYNMEIIMIFTKDKQKTISYGKNEPFNYDTLKYGTVPKKAFNHVSSKPVELIATLIQHYSNEGETVFDGFGGSGSTAEAAIKTKRKYILVERDVDHYKTILQRITNVNSQMDLFL